MKVLHSINQGSTRLSEERRLAIASWFRGFAELYIDENGFVCYPYQSDTWLRLNHWTEKEWNHIVESWKAQGSPTYPISFIEKPKGKIINYSSI